MSTTGYVHPRVNQDRAIQQHKITTCNNAVYLSKRAAINKKKAVYTANKTNSEKTTFGLR